MRGKKSLWAALAVFTSLAGVSQGAIVVAPSTNALAMATAVAQQMGVTLVVNDNLRYAGAPLASGFFTGAAGTLPMDRGVLLTTGSVERVPGPNSGEGLIVGNGTPGDADLSALVGKARTFDAALLEFDFIPGQNRQVGFRFVFGSEEYNEWAQPPVKYDDVLGVFLNGQNIAVIPEVGLPISVSRVSEVWHQPYYTDNSIASGAPYNLEYDGMIGNSVGAREAQPLGAFGIVQPGVNHIKIGVADTGDAFFDSGVFIEATSVPEPTTGAVIVVGAAFAGLRGRGRRRD
jgi:hypothetical protein